MIECTPDVSHFLVTQPFSQLAGCVARPVVREQSWLSHNMSLIAARRLQGEIQCFSNIARLHGRAQLPGDDIARVIIEDRRQVHPTPTNDLQINEVGLPQLIALRIMTTARACCSRASRTQSASSLGERLRQESTARFRRYKKIKVCARCTQYSHARRSRRAADQQFIIFISRGSDPRNRDRPCQIIPLSVS
jgi:hypothetical protein